MKTLIQEKHNQSESCITVEVSGRMQKVEIYLANEGSGLAFFSMDLGHNFGGNAGNEFGVMLRRKQPHKLEVASDIVPKQSLRIYTDLFENTILSATQTFNYCAAFLFSKLKSDDIITTGQYRNNQTFSNLQFRPLLENCFNSIHHDLGDTRIEKKPFVYVGIIRLVLMSRTASNIRFLSERRYKTVASRQKEIPFSRGNGRQFGRGIGAFAQINERTTKSIFFRKYLVPAAKWPGADLLKISVPEIVGIVSHRISRHLQRALEDRLWKNSWVVVAGRRLKAESFEQNLQNKSFLREDTFFGNVSQQSCQTIFGTNFLWTFLEFLEGKAQ